MTPDWLALLFGVLLEFGVAVVSIRLVERVSLGFLPDLRPALTFLGLPWVMERSAVTGRD